MRGGRSREDARRGLGLTNVPPAAPSLAAIVAAGGKGERFGGEVPKQFLEVGGEPMVVRSAGLFLQAGCTPVVVAAPVEHLELTRALFERSPKIEVVGGGATRRASVSAALQQVATDHVLVHDAARPLVPASLIRDVIDALEQADAVVPAIPVADALKRVEEGIVAATVDRSNLWSVQTPQGFRTDLLRRVHAEVGVDHAPDDAALVERMGGRVRVVPGSRRNLKITTAEDLRLADELALGPGAGIRIGHGFDVHAFEDGGRLVIGGVEVPHPRGLSGHSDADVLSHAVADAILGAAGLGDLGARFPADDRWKDASSLEILAATSRAARERHWLVVNVDATVVAEEPKLSPFRDEMAARLAEAIAVSPDAVSVKATTSDGLGSAGRGEGVAAHAVVLIRRLR